jgi:hypothetical protein
MNRFIETLYIGLVVFVLPFLILWLLTIFMASVGPMALGAVTAAIACALILVMGSQNLFRKATALLSASAAFLLSAAFLYAGNPSEPYQRVYRQIKAGMTLEELELLIAREFPESNGLTRPTTCLILPSHEYRIDPQREANDRSQMIVSLDDENESVVSVRLDKSELR